MGATGLGQVLALVGFVSHKCYGGCTGGAATAPERERVLAGVIGAWGRKDHWLRGRGHTAGERASLALPGRRV